MENELEARVRATFRAVTLATTTLFITGLMAWAPAPAGAVEIVWGFDMTVRTEPDPGPPVEPGGVAHVRMTVSNLSDHFVLKGTYQITSRALVRTSSGVQGLPTTFTCEVPATVTCAPQYRPVSERPDEFVSGDIPPFGTLVFHLAYDIPEDAQVGLFTQAAIAYAPSTRDQNPSNDTAPLLALPFQPTADVGVTIDNGRTAYAPGPSTYDVVVTNHGPDPVDEYQVLDGPGITGTSWTCEPSPGAACTTSGSGDFSDLVALPVGGSVTYHITVTPPPAGPPTSDQKDSLYGIRIAPPLIDTIADAPAPGGGTEPVHIVLTIPDPNPANDQALDYDFAPAGPDQADTGITIDNGQDSVGASEVVTYQVVVANAGPAATSGQLNAIMAPFDPSSVTWTCAPEGGATCTPSGTGTTNPGSPVAVGIGGAVSLPVGAKATYSITAKVQGSYGGNTAVNALYITDGVPAGGNPLDDFAIDGDPIVPNADLEVTVGNGVDAVVRGQPTTSTLTVTNHGPDPAQDVRIDEVLPDAFEGATWTCTPTGGATCSASGPGPVVQRGLTIPVGASVTFTVTGTVAATATSPFTTSASVGLPALALPQHPSQLDPVTENNTATDSDIVAMADPGVAVAAPATATVGDTIPITVTVTNHGALPAGSTELQVPVPAGTTFVSAATTAGAAPTLTTPSVGSTGIVRATWPALSAGQSATLVVRVAISRGVTVGSDLSSSARVTTTGPNADTGNDEANATTRVTQDRTTRITVYPPSFFLLNSTLVDGSGRPIAGARVDYVTRWGAIVCVATTNAHGDAPCVSGIAYWTYLVGGVEARFSGDAQHDPAADHTWR